MTIRNVNRQFEVKFLIFRQDYSKFSDVKCHFTTVKLEPHSGEEFPLYVHVFKSTLCQTVTKLCGKIDFCVTHIRYDETWLFLHIIEHRYFNIDPTRVKHMPHYRKFSQLQCVSGTFCSTTYGFSCTSNIRVVCWGENMLINIHVVNFIPLFDYVIYFKMVIYLFQ